MCPALLIICLALCLPASDGTAYTASHQAATGAAHRLVSCRITPQFVSPFVFVSRYVAVNISAGCVSRQLSESSAEVHVIKLQGSSRTAQTANRRRHGDLLPVTLNVQSMNGSKNTNRTVVFILDSDRPVQWTLQLQAITNASRLAFWVSKESRLTKTGRWTSRVRKVSLPESRDAMLRWAERRAGTVTSFSELGISNKIYKTIGTDVSLPERCVPTSPFYSHTASATYEQRVSSSGCIDSGVNHTLNNHINVFVLELTGRPLGGSTAVQVTLDGVGGSVVDRNIVLVLKSAPAVNWVVTTRRLHGTLDIYTGDGVSKATAMQPVRVVVERLAGFSGAGLLAWVYRQHMTGLSYTGALHADHFTIMVHPSESASASSLPQPEPDDTHGLQAVLTHTKSVKCQHNGMTLSFHKPLLQLHGVTAHQLSLRDESCVAMENETHFVLQAPFSGCGTSRQSHSNIIVYHNMVMLRVAQDEETVEGSGTEEVSDTHVDDEDFVDDRRREAQPKTAEPVVISLEFSCGYLYDDIVALLPMNPVQYRINIYKDETFSRNFTGYPYHVSENEMMFVEARIDADPSLGIMIESCWLSASQNRATQHELIRSGCTMEQVMRWYSVRGKQVGTDTDSESKARRFSFKYYKYWQEDISSYIQCRLVICSLVSSANTQMCVPQKKYCLRNSVQTDDVHDTLANSKVVVGGPITLILPPSPTDDHNASRLSPGAPLTLAAPAGGASCDTRRALQGGLDLTTVITITFAAFFIGVLLTVTIWYIYMKTAGPLADRLSKRPRSNESSGESTPSSTAPIAIHQVNQH